MPLTSSPWSEPGPRSTMACYREGSAMTRGPLHHVELWVPNLARATASIGWLLEALGYQAHQNWDRGRSWRLGDTYIVIERSPALTGETHDRLRPGLNHLAFHAGASPSPTGSSPMPSITDGRFFSPALTPTPVEPSTALVTSPTPTASRSNSSPPSRK